MKSGRINKRKHELYELHINERAAAVVQIIFDKYVHEGYGPQHKAQKDLISLKAEILACIKGESVFPKETLAEMITAQEEKLRELDALYESSYAETEKTAELMDNVSKLYEELISFSDLYDSASFEAKKMIVNQLVRRVDVYRGYQLNITFNFDLTPYIEGDDAAAC